MEEDQKKKKVSENAAQEEDRQITEFSNNFGRVELIVLPQLEVMARMSGWTS